MSPTKPGNQIDYLEVPASHIEKTKTFYQSVFGWEFTDYGPDYTSFHEGRMAGGFSKELPAGQVVLLVLYSSDLAGVQQKILAAGGRIVKDTFSFPGGRRFHFSDPNGNELAVWSE
jgi:predicted enzyme related to lactoylglutathione lyase